MVLAVVLTFHCYISKYHKFSSLKQHKYIVSQFLQVRNLNIVRLGSLLRSHRLKSSCQPELCFSSRSSSKLTRQLVEFISVQNYRTEVPVSLLAVKQGLFLAPRGCPHYCTYYMTPSIFKPTGACRVFM